MGALLIIFDSIIAELDSKNLNAKYYVFSLIAVKDYPYQKTTNINILGVIVKMPRQTENCTLL